MMASSSNQHYPNSLTHEEILRVSKLPAGAHGEAPDNDHTDLESGTHAQLKHAPSSASLIACQWLQGVVPEPVRDSLARFAQGTLAGIDYVGMKLAGMFGLTEPRYAEFIEDAAHEAQQEQNYLIQQSLNRPKETLGANGQPAPLQLMTTVSIAGGPHNHGTSVVPLVAPTKSSALQLGGAYPQVGPSPASLS
ncbi:hypothetical protein BCR44DRAFT_1483974 [Catenaria anguillulae PL171]|uniref:Uncharacterized protein n=1 Tax=Catenaria anguillulae PL171 TaxID=765915 RepID=A0A1Y2HSC3_9FUNG|nr:hypothetical protein BCR44DRAFT_1483974 [Catenaria anguillulae PL171]